MRGLNKYKKLIKTVLFAVYISFFMAVCIILADELLLGGIL
jgi:hypothetical protein